MLVEADPHNQFKVLLGTSRERRVADSDSRWPCAMMGQRTAASTKRTAVQQGSL